MKDKNIKIIRAKRKSVSIRVSDEGLVVVRAPKNVSDAKLNKFLNKSGVWINKKLIENKKQNEKLENYKFCADEINRIKKGSRKNLEKRTNEISENIDVKYKKFRLSGAKKRWGSCNNKKTISINWKLVFAPPEIIDYVITHELAHLKHMNHSKKFWLYVEKYIPDYKKHRKWLNENDYLLRVGESSPGHTGVAPR